MCAKCRRPCINVQIHAPLWWNHKLQNKFTCLLQWFCKLDYFVHVMFHRVVRLSTHLLRLCFSNTLNPSLIWQELVGYWCRHGFMMFAMPLVKSFEMLDINCLGIGVDASLWLSRCPWWKALKWKSVLQSNRWNYIFIFSLSDISISLSCNLRNASKQRLVNFQWHLHARCKLMVPP